MSKKATLDLSEWEKGYMAKLIDGWRDKYPAIWEGIDDKPILDLNQAEVEALVTAMESSYRLDDEMSKP